MRNGCKCLHWGVTWGCTFFELGERGERPETAIDSQHSGTIEKKLLCERKKAWEWQMLTIKSLFDRHSSMMWWECVEQAGRLSVARSMIRRGRHLLIGPRWIKPTAKWDFEGFRLPHTSTWELSQINRGLVIMFLAKKLNLCFMIISPVKSKLRKLRTSELMSCYSAYFLLVSSFQEFVKSFDICN